MNTKANPSSDAWVQRHVDRTSQTDDARIKDITVLPPPEHLIRFFPISDTPVETLITGTRKAHPQHHGWQGRPPAGGDRPVLDPRSGRRHRLRAAPEAAARPIRRHAGDRDARVLRKAAHHRGLEGADQRPLPGRELPHRRGPAHRAPAAHRDQPPGPARRQRVSRRDLAPVHRRPDRLGRDRRAHHREPGAPRAGFGPVGTHRLQERHRRQHQDRHRCHPGRGARPPLFVGAQERPGRDRADQRQQGLPRHPARRQGAQLRRGQRGSRLQGA